MAVMLSSYDVAIWKWFDGVGFPCVDEVASTSPLLAVLSLMRGHGLRGVGHAAVLLPDGVEVRWEKGLVLRSSSAPPAVLCCDWCGVALERGSLWVMCGDVGWCLGCVPVYVHWRVPVVVCVPAGFLGRSRR